MRNCINEPTDRRKIKAFFERQAKNEATASIASGYSKRLAKDLAQHAFESRNAKTNPLRSSRDMAFLPNEAK
jgi:hypothetical protein